MSEGLLRLDTDNAAVSARTDLAIAASEDVKPLLIRCAGCGTKLAAIGDTDYGPLFASSWKVQGRDPHAVIVDGERLKPREQSRHMREAYTVEYQEGEPLDFTEQHGVMTLLALPGDMAQDFPDLLVRCPKHGDAVLDRVTVLKWLRAGKAPAVSVAFPQRAYRPQGIVHGGEAARSVTTRRRKR